MNIGTDGQAVAVPFGDAVRLEVRPAFTGGGGSFPCPDSNGGGSRKRTDPKSEIQGIRNRNEDCNRSLIRLRRMMRVRKARMTVPFGGLPVDYPRPPGRTLGVRLSSPLPESDRMHRRRRSAAGADTGRGPPRYEPGRLRNGRTGGAARSRSRLRTAPGGPVPAGRTRRGRGGAPLLCDVPRRGQTGILPVTIDGDIRGFRGLRLRWWPREIERAFRPQASERACVPLPRVPDRHPVPHRAVRPRLPHPHAAGVRLVGRGRRRRSGPERAPRAQRPGRLTRVRYDSRECDFEKCWWSQLPWFPSLLASCSFRARYGKASGTGLPCCLMLRGYG